MEKLASKYWIVLITFLLINTNGFSQNLDSIKVKKFTITTSVLDYISEFRTFDEITYNIEFSAPIKKRNFVHFNVGYLKSTETAKIFLSAFPNPIDKTQGYRVQLEGRHYLNKHKLFEPSLVLFWLGLFQYKSIVQDNTGYYVAFQSKYQFTTTERTETVVDFVNNNPFPNTTHYKKMITRLIEKNWLAILNLDITQ